MKKQAYLKPTMRVVQLQHQCQILTGSSVRSVRSNLGNDELHWGDGSSEDAR